MAHAEKPELMEEVSLGIKPLLHRGAVPEISRGLSDQRERYPRMAVVNGRGTQEGCQTHLCDPSRVELSVRSHPGVSSLRSSTPGNVKNGPLRGRRGESGHDPCTPTAKAMANNNGAACTTKGKVTALFLSSGNTATTNGNGGLRPCNKPDCTATATTERQKERGPPKREKWVTFGCAQPPPSTKGGPA